MAAPRGDKPAHPPIDAGPSFEADSLVVPEGLDREGLGGRRPQKRPKTAFQPWIFASAIGVVGIVGVVVWRSAQPPAHSVSVEPLADPEASPAQLANAGRVEGVPASHPPSASPSPTKAEASAAPAPERDEPTPREGAHKKRPHGGGTASGPAVREEAVDEALARLSQQSGAELRKQGKLEAARVALAKECDEGRGASCEAAAEMAERGEGGDRDSKAARDAQEKGCALRSAPSCLAVAHVYKQDPATRQLAAEKLGAACSYASAQGCREAAEMLEANHDAASDARALSLRSRACTLGDKDSCKAMKAATSSVP